MIHRGATLYKDQWFHDGDTVFASSGNNLYRSGWWKNWVTSLGSRYFDIQVIGNNWTENEKWLSLKWFYKWTCSEIRRQIPIPLIAHSSHSFIDKENSKIQKDIWKYFMQRTREDIFIYNYTTQNSSLELQHRLA